MTLGLPFPVSLHAEAMLVIAGPPLGSEASVHERVFPYEDPIDVQPDADEVKFQEYE
jgi:hypothetical protein